MADVDFDEFDDSGYDPHVPAAPHGRGSRLVNVAGALSSIALIVGLGLWGYKIAVRNVMGIPVVRALEGPMRIAPDDPGGEVADHQGLSVNDIAAVGEAAPVAERLVLAPRPVELSLDDAPGLTADAPPVADTVADAVAEAIPGPPPEAAAEPSADAAALPDAADLPPVDANANVLALAEALASGIEPLSDPTAAPGSEATAVDPTAPAAPMETAAVVPGGIAKSLRPQGRPTSLQATAAAPVTAAPAPVTEIDPATLTPGTRLVQLGAFDDEETARKEWDKLAAQFGELLEGKGRVVQAAQSGGRTFFRLRAHGFEGEDDARRFCSALLAENAACIPVAVR